MIDSINPKVKNNININEFFFSNILFIYDIKKKIFVKKDKIQNICINNKKSLNDLNGSFGSLLELLKKSPIINNFYIIISKKKTKFKKNYNFKHKIKN